MVFFISFVLIQNKRKQRKNQARKTPIEDLDFHLFSLKYKYLYFSEGAKAQGHTVLSYRLEDMDIQGCKGCGSCFGIVTCIQTDDMQVLYPELLQADHIVIGYPIYMGQMTSQTKKMFDRWLALCNPGFTTRLTKHPKLTFLVSAGNGSPELIEKYVESTIQAFSFLGIETKDYLIAYKNANIDDVEAQKDIIEKAYQLGKEL